LSVAWARYCPLKSYEATGSDESDEMIGTGLDMFREPLNVLSPTINICALHLVNLLVFSIPDYQAWLKEF